jgi:hypothetical protein
MSFCRFRSRFDMPSSAKHGTEILRVVVTEVPSDFRPLVQGGIRNASVREISPLEDLLGVALAGPLTRDVVRKVVGKTDCAVIDRPMTLRRK